MASHTVRFRVATGGAATVLALCTACGSSSDSSGSAKSDAVSPAGSVSCGAVLAAVDDLAATVKGWKAGNDTRGEVVASARALSSVVTSQASAASGEAGKDLEALGSAVTGLVSTAIHSSSERDIDRAEAKVSSTAATLATTCE